MYGSMTNPAYHIRKNVLGLSQAALAQALEVTQATVCRWETAGRFPSEHQPRIREMGMKARPDWQDSWFFEAPQSDSEAA